MNPILIKIITTITYLFIGYAAYKTHEIIDKLKKDIKKLDDRINKLEDNGLR